MTMRLRGGGKGSLGYSKTGVGGFSVFHMWNALTMEFTESEFLRNVPPNDYKYLGICVYVEYIRSAVSPRQRTAQRASLAMCPPPPPTFAVEGMR
jgi:hypothetical protein